MLSVQVIHFYCVLLGWDAIESRKWALTPSNQCRPVQCFPPLRKFPSPKTGKGGTALLIKAETIFPLKKVQY